VVAPSANPGGPEISEDWDESVEIPIGSLDLGVPVSADGLFDARVSEAPRVEPAPPRSSPPPPAAERPAPPVVAAPAQRFEAAPLPPAQAARVVPLPAVAPTPLRDLAQRSLRLRLRRPARP